jgi:hypothetical protein
MELPIPPSDRCIHKLPHPEKVSTQKNWLDSNNDEISIRKKCNPDIAAAKKNYYVDKMDCRRSCCCGCKLENVDARKSGGKVCWNRLKILTILFFVSSVASSVPGHKTCKT